MMHIIALSLVLASLITGTVWSPPPPSRHGDGDHSEVIVKEGHRVVVVEYEKEADGHTKVLISPHDPSGFVDVKDSSKVAGEEKPAERKFSGPRELVCDAFGKCKHKLAHALGKTKEKVSDKAHDIEVHAKEAASGAIGKAKETVHGAKETVHGFEERVKEAVNEGFRERVEEMVSTGHTIGDSLGEAKESMSQGIDKAKKVAGDVMGAVKDGVAKTKEFDVVDSPKRIGEDIQRNVSGKYHEGAEHIMEHAKETAENVQKAGQKSLSEILTKLQELAYDVIWFMVSLDKLDAVVSLVHMLGFSTAYGMCVWVTFVSSYILGRYLPREQFGMVQSRIYPVYFRAMAYCVGAALLGHVITQRNKILCNMIEIFQGLSLFSAILMLLSNMMWLEPKSTKLMFERMKIEKEEGRGVAGAVKEGLADCGGSTVARPPAKVVAERHDVLRMNEKLKKLNTYSSALNVSTLVVLTWHMAYMGHRLQGTR